MSNVTVILEAINNIITSNLSVSYICLQDAKVLSDETSMHTLEIYV